MIRESFPEFCSTSDGNGSSSSLVPSGNNDLLNSRDPQEIIEDNNSSSNHNSTPSLENVAKFSDDEEEVNSVKNCKKNKDKDNRANNKVANRELIVSNNVSFHALAKTDLSVQIDHCGSEDIRNFLTKLYEEK